MFCNCSCEEGSKVAALVSNSRRSKSNQVSVFTVVFGSLMNTSNLFSTPFWGMFKTMPPGSEVWKKAPRLEALLAIAFPALLAALLALLTALFTELPRLKNQRSRARTIIPRIASGQIRLEGRSGTSGCISATREETCVTTLPRPGRGMPAGRRLGGFGNSAESKLPSPEAERPSECRLDEIVPRTMGEAAARIDPAEEARTLETWAIWP